MHVIEGLVSIRKRKLDEEVVIADGAHTIQSRDISYPATFSPERTPALLLSPSYPSLHPFLAGLWFGFIRFRMG